MGTSMTYFNDLCDIIQWHTSMTSMTCLVINNQHLSVSPPCWTSPGCLRPSGVKVLEPWSMCGTDALQMLSRVVLLINCGLAQSLMCLTFECGAALLMFTYRRIREKAWALTWRSWEILLYVQASYISLFPSSKCRSWKYSFYNLSITH